ncbi:hypothetical protein TCAL_03216 [Tigriopus californicus]|uniref:Mismatch repair endonuclease PMS2 n=1 Tax=Tigriopus californicus TaxID=6832 RepID=A0A553NTW9_TIGCA|nr:mismatch repair endonuclease PMS2-like [Tigriopus californicus]TRY68853.1 hypothetical protein TCAL_03216 [Tigriopus californicus]|eukprot:TCALIF_03216-PA protein Name:"Similar to PMS2 Mismatch repair endonuclease PMS2 (Homo sapiens)" AED:0.04 eAED:0.04 QI:93/1/1/1/0.66/0.75/4/16/752
MVVLNQDFHTSHRLTRTGPTFVRNRKAYAMNTNTKRLSHRPSSHGPSIQRVDLDTVHRICSGQVVLTLSTAVKELVENSLDAGAQAIEVKLTNHGLGRIEITDDGHGIPPENFQALTLKHHTSKIQAFHDLESVGTFGFRGEALSSLCALSHLRVNTRHSSQSLGCDLTFDAQGTLTQTESIVRNLGTSVILEGLFEPIPVRRKEFERNIKREFAKMIHILQAYCLISTGVRFFATNSIKDKKRTIAHTSGNASLKDNIVDVFGSRHFQSLLPIKAKSPSPEELESFEILDLEQEPELKLEGFISSCSHGSGRSSTDRQFYFINHRPCDPTKIAKLVNDVYHQFNRHQYPFVVLNIQLPRESVDINVTPDKRQLLLEREKYLLATLQASLKAMFARIPAEIETVSRFIEKRPSRESSEKINLQSTITVCRDNCSLKRSSQSSKSLPLKQMKLESVTKQTPPAVQIDKKGSELHSEAPSAEISEEKRIVIEIEDHGQKPKQRRSIQAQFCPDLSTRNLQFKWDRKKEAQASSQSGKFRSFLAKIAPEDNSQAEQELARHFDQGNFKEMQILGQFNLGFIITRYADDLFIVDQHASDEKYNYEKLQKANILESQNMVVAQPLALSASDEGILLDNLDVFEKNGFEFEIDLEATHDRIKLTRIPHYRNWIFGQSEVEELIFMLTDAPPEKRLCRPSRVQAMFASRACRTSVMIGTALNAHELRRIVYHMGEMDQPWHCPHGRPTMRHLINLNMIQ